MLLAFAQVNRLGLAAGEPEVEVWVQQRVRNCYPLKHNDTPIASVR